MSDYGSLQDHADAVMARLYAADPLIVYPRAEGGSTTVPVGASPPYVSVHMVAIRVLNGRLNHRSTRLAMRIYCHCVGADDAQSRFVSDLVAGALLDVVLVIDGRVCYPIRNEVGRPDEPREDESIGSLRATITDTYRLESMPGRRSS